MMFKEINNNCRKLQVSYKNFSSRPFKALKVHEKVYHRPNFRQFVAIWRHRSRLSSSVFFKYLLTCFPQICHNLGWYHLKVRNPCLYTRNKCCPNNSRILSYYFTSFAQQYKHFCITVHDSKFSDWYATQKFTKSSKNFKITLQNRLCD